MYTEEDRRRLLESRHDLGALAEPGALTDNKAMLDAAVASRDELAVAREALRLAASSIDREHTRETSEDADAMKALRAAREAFDRSASANSHLMESILVRQRREAELGRFVLAREAAYAARRANHTPISAEPGAEQPAATPAAAPAAG